MSPIRVVSAAGHWFQASGTPGLGVAGGSPAELSAGAAACRTSRTLARRPMANCTAVSR